MAIRALNEFIPVQLFKNDGTINAGGSLEFYENLTLTPTDVYAESTLVTNLGDTITLDGAGRWLSSEVWLPTVVRVRCKDSLGNLLWSLDNINLDTSTSSAINGGNLITNGSFETDTNADNIPDGWTLTAYTGSTNTLITTDQTDGAKSLRSSSIGNGGGSWQHDDYIPVSPLKSFGWEFSIKSSVADVRNIIELLWYDAAKVQLGGGSALTTLYDRAVNNPTSWLHVYGNVAPPSGAYYCRPRVKLCDPSDATVGNTTFDAFKLGDPFATSTADAKITYKAAADPGWIMANDNSIGNAGSGATNRANQDTELLYTALWNNVADAWCPVSTGRGASALADFYAGKTLTLSRTLGRALARAGAGSGLTSRALGEYLGAETITLGVSEVPQLTVDFNYGGNDATYRTGTNLTGTDANNATTKNTNGGGGAHSNMPPEAFTNVMVKL